jgi:hypothetical protein
MSKPTNFRYSNSLIARKQHIVDNKGSVFIKGNPTHLITPPSIPISTPSSVAIIGGMSRHSVNVGNGSNNSPESNYNHAKDFIGAEGNACVRAPFPMKHWRRQLLMNGKSGKSASSVEIINRPGGTSFRGYRFEPSEIYYDSMSKSWKSNCKCDASGNNMFITFDNKLLQNTSKSIKPPSVIPTASIGSGGNSAVGQGQVGNKIYNPGYIQIGPENEPNSYQIQTGVYNIKTICCTPESNVIKYSANTNLSQTYYSNSSAYLKARCKLYSQKMSTIEISGNTYVDNNGNAVYPSNSSTGSQNFKTKNCSYPYQTGKEDTCNITIYKRSNPTFATQGAVDNGTRIAKLKYDTITLNGNSFRSAWGDSAANAGKYHGDFNGNSPYFIKSKYTPPMTWRRRGKRQLCNGCVGGPRTSLSSFWGGI